MFSYPGGKNRHARWIIPLLPVPHHNYCEVFGGAFWIYQRLRPTGTVIYNDKNRLLANSWYCMSKKYKALLDVCANMPAENEILYSMCKDDLYTNYTTSVIFGDVLKAAQYLYLETQRYIGAIPVGPKCSMVRMDGIKYRPKWEVFIDRLVKDKDMLLAIDKIECKDFETIIKKYDNKDMIFYVDPPYYGTEHYYTEGDFDQKDHERLSIVLSSIKGKFALSYYDFPNLNQYYPKSKFTWHTQSVVKSMGTTKTYTTASKGEEILIMNY